MPPVCSAPILARSSLTLQHYVAVGDLIFMNDSVERNIVYLMITPAKALQGLDALDLSADARADFLGRNAQRVFELR